MAERERLPVLFDTDIGSDVDDALALALILACPEVFELVAVTTVAGDTALRARIAAGLLGLASRRDVEVCVGERRPVLRGAARFGLHGHEARCVIDGPTARIGEEGGPERIVRAAREVPGLTIVAVGPMTNLARALALDPELPGRVRGVTIMGGHIRQVKIGAHVCAPGIDYNLCSDPEATVAVLGAGFATTLVSADVTLQTWMRTPQLCELEASGPLGAALGAQVRLWEPIQRRIFTGLGGTVADDNCAFLHDPLAVYSLVDPSVLEFEELRIATTVQRGILRTFEVDRGSGALGAMGTTVRVATRVDAAAAERAMLRRLVDASRSLSS